jgi:hypothetical protein
MFSHDNIFGLLYLENDLVSGAFTEERLKILHIRFFLSKPENKRRGAMRKNCFLMLSHFFAVCFPGASAWAGDMDREELKKVYEGYIAASGDMCKFKTGLRYSRSDAIRTEATVSCLKNTYFMNNKDELIREMIAQNVGVKPYQIKVFLDARFYAFAKSRHMNVNVDHPLAALPTEPPDGVENMSVRQLCRYFSVPLKLAVEKLEMNKMVKGDPASAGDMALAGIAAQNGASPESVYLSLR